MPFTAQELANVTNAALEFHFERGKVFTNSVSAKPLLREMYARKKFFPSGKDNITVRVKGEYTTTIQGYTHDDIVGYANPANIRDAAYPWREIHWGIKVTLTELKTDGISVVDSATSSETSEHSKRELTALANLLEDKLEDMAEGSARGLNTMYWLDGTQDSKLVPGIKSFLVDNPAASLLVGGIDQGVNTWWRNRANLAINLGASPNDNNLINFLQSEMRFLRRFAGGEPAWVALAGSAFLDQLEREIRAKGNYTLGGWAKSGGIDISMADVEFKGLNFEYDPTLDDLGESKRCYLIDTKNIMPMFMTDEFMKKHNPARPEDQYVMYRAMTLTGGLVCRQRNTSGVYGFA